MICKIDRKKLVDYGFEYEEGYDNYLYTVELDENFDDNDYTYAIYVDRNNLIYVEYDGLDRYSRYSESDCFIGWSSKVVDKIVELYELGVIGKEE